MSILMYFSVVCVLRWPRAYDIDGRGRPAFSMLVAIECRNECGPCLFSVTTTPDLQIILLIALHTMPLFAAQYGALDDRNTFGNVVAGLPNLR